MGDAKPLLAPRLSLAWTTVAFIALITASFMYLSTCRQDPNFSFCSASWGLLPRPPGSATSLPGCLAAPLLGTQILGRQGGFLPPDALRRGIASYGSGMRMERLGHKLLQGQPLSVAFIGGSITWGRGGYEGSPFTARFAAWLNDTFPHPDHKFVNLGLPAVTSALFAACYDSVPQDADFVVLDFAVNDGHISPPGRDKYGYSFTGAPRRGFEQLVRKSLKLPRSPAVALLHFYSWNATRDKERVDGLDVPLGESFFFRTIEDDLSTAAQYYDLPVLSLRNAAYHLLREQRHGFRWNVSIHSVTRDMPQKEQDALKDSQFFWDENHPWDRTGHRALAELLMAAMSRAVQAAADTQLGQLERMGALGASSAAAVRSKLAEARALKPPPQLPPPMVPGNYEANATSCHLQEEFQAVIKAAKGFEYAARAPQEATFVAQKWGLSAEKPGANATLELDSGLGTAAGELTKVQVHLLFLRSWSGMGRASLRCSGGCECQAQEMDGHWDRQATLTDLFTFEVTPHPKCRLEVVVLPESSSGEHRFSLSGVVVSSLDAKLERGKIGQWDIEQPS